ncbi:MAG: outer membrane beta-barrel protein [Akkermansiaceae bacterium]|nr:outer membrane beta-barrel protein [Akkermansiaceae bacterium]
MTLLTGLALAITAQAGEDYSAKGGKEVIAPPAPSCLWSWFAGASAGQVTGDWDEEIYTLHVGAEYKCPGSNCSQAIYLEVGYTEDNERVYYQDPFTSTNVNYAAHDVSAEIIPITLNYKYECALTGSLNWYIGAGAGIALVDTEVRGPFVSNSQDDTAFYAHIFAGLVYNLSESFEIFGGARFIFMDDVFGVQSPLDEEVHYELGGRFNF